MLFRSCLNHLWHIFQLDTAIEIAISAQPLAKRNMKIYRGHPFALVNLNKDNKKSGKSKAESRKLSKKSYSELQIANFYIPLQSQSPDGEMVDALVSGASAERRVGSSPILGTRSSDELLFLCPNRARSACGASADSSVVGCCRRSSSGWWLSFSLSEL